MKLKFALQAEDNQSVEFLVDPVIIWSKSANPYSLITKRDSCN